MIFSFISLLLFSFQYYDLLSYLLIHLLSGVVKRFCPWNRAHDPKEASQSSCLEAFSHFTFLHSNGQLLACDFQGVKHEDNASPSYVITDTIIHSHSKNYGPFDKGVEGINEFFKLHKCSSLCRGWPVPAPLTPPPAFSSLPLTPPPAFEDIVFPFPRPTASESNLDRRRRPSSVRDYRRQRHYTGDGPTTDNTLFCPSNSNSANNLGLLSPSSCYSYNDQGDSQEHRMRSSSSSDLLTPQRNRFQSERNTSATSPMVMLHVPAIPSAPPMYEECINGDSTWLDIIVVILIFISYILWITIFIIYVHLKVIR